jgi:hypothetical protein
MEMVVGVVAVVVMVNIEVVEELYIYEVSKK